MPVSNITNF